MNSDNYIKDGLIIAQNEVHVKYKGESRKIVPLKTLDIMRILKKQ